MNPVIMAATWTPDKSPSAGRNKERPPYQVEIEDGSGAVLGRGHRAGLYGHCADARRCTSGALENKAIYIAKATTVSANGAMSSGIPVAG